MKTQHVYRLAVEYPEGSLEPGWAPDNWRGADLYGFQWPKVKHYLSAGGAAARASLLSSYGAAVTIEKSAPVVWP